jgi:hypothetical protein
MLALRYTWPSVDEVAKSPGQVYPPGAAAAAHGSTLREPGCTPRRDGDRWVRLAPAVAAISTGLRALYAALLPRGLLREFKRLRRPGGSTLRIEYIANSPYKLLVM